MDRLAGQITASHGRLHPAVEPFARHMLEVGSGHTLYVEECGNPAGRPVVVLHGGPGGGCSPFMRRFFDPDHYRVVLFDQRGCGRSRPQASVEANTTPHLVADIEAIRTHLGIDRWLLFGGSWGATLAVAYAETHPDRTTGLVLRGVFLGMQTELDWFYGGGAGRFFPDLWAQFQEPIPEAERGDMIAAYHARLFDPDTSRQARFAQPWLMWENALAGLQSSPGSHAPADYARAFARLENHFFSNRCFLDEGQLLRDRHRIEHLPAVIVQGRYDMVCPPLSAWRLADGWDRCQMRLVPASGHALSEPRITAELAGVMDQIRDDDRTSRGDE
ncbi:prolyl aminopeptidase [Paracoccus sp. 1_MG-2023]|uniref:prolyl aminopeptidase n=1 Tax=unclassified Paracoccus (in: a-proteobacteria) TaxID=2688777 RepID=UPI001C0940A3|nr:MULTISPECIES: prolyl aminopeptidase [unclassified Paracoccus (in: a-proteobacteria)]MBU2957030.1 prolyl aminopeptidase [Paracoccus sp. C2R09]MDO6668228.1 prolyl aminopeptidase [Paracoccus sp. 1_MG-2023]